jgi:hypothetical protein
MSTEVQKVDLLRAIDAAHDQALAALEDPERTGCVAVAHCSAHLAAVDCVLYAAARRRVRDGRLRVRSARSADRALQQAVCRLDRRLTGDVHLGDVPLEDLARQVEERLLVHADVERRLVGSLQVLLGPDEQQALADALDRAATSAPTRPHPHTRHTPLASLVARLDAGVDRVRDVMDNRVVATGRSARAARRPGRWGCYLMGVPYPEREHLQG